ncbi:LamG domain-containing protein [Candidatus Poribacteria bacterium]
MSRWNVFAVSLITLLVCCSMYRALSQEPELIGRWPLDETSGNVVHDEIANNNGEFVGGDLEWVQANFDNGLQFDGTAKYVNIPKNPDLEPQTLTLCMWVKFNSVAAHNRQDIFCYADSYQILKMGSVFRGGIHQGGGWPNAIGVTAIQDGEWYFVAETYDGKDLKLYVNGEPDGTIAAAGNIDYMANVEFWLGGAAGDVGQAFWFDGILDEVQVWNKAMTEDEIMELYQSPLPSSAVSWEGKLATTWGNLKAR